jgi:hypothetical protein
VKGTGNLSKVWASYVTMVVGDDPLMLSELRTVCSSLGTDNNNNKVSLKSSVHKQSIAPGINNKRSMVLCRTRYRYCALLKATVARNNSRYSIASRTGISPSRRAHQMFSFSERNPIVCVALNRSSIQAFVLLSSLCFQAFRAFQPLPFHYLR